MFNVFQNIFHSIYKKWIFRKIDSATISKLNGEMIVDPELLLLGNFLHKDDIAFDIGTNVGEYTYVLERYVGSENVYSFEPIPALFKTLKKRFKNVIVEPMALSNKSGSSQFKIPIINGIVFQTRGKLDLGITEPGETNYEIIEVQCNTIDEYVNRKAIPMIKFLKIDVEGHEVQVLKGGIKTINRSRPIMLIEIEQRHHLVPIDTIFEFIKELGYEIKFYSLKELRYVDVESFDIIKHQDYNNINSLEYINNFWCFPENKE